MNEYTIHSAKMVPLDRSNIDTDQIIPKQFLKSIKKTGFGPNLFDSWRYLDSGFPGQDNSKRQLNPEFVLNDKKYKGSEVLISKENFGCGSSREHAVWAMQDYGIKCVIAQSFADIFYNNCFKNGLLAISLSKDSIEELFRLSEKGENIHVDLINQVILDSNELEIVKFEIEDFRKTSVLEGLDEIGLSLKYSKSIMSYEENIKKLTPWIFK
ncbi:MAG TPA: 3-isopropylmalate dehydratase small subunit [Gammaproteobacteria bacterium]|jgi:3-isopropylmalate/(R)-2-methylmalate dehydratase small subunit|nr:3-isopropylmalate dehydratase small subunit [Gammaproteobacteria bacterium]HIA95997.1 3-isopropylmalate dehydratase small subunit [Gammaproteobacteria bacterium]HIG49914.1 3-isopropylmalate dehydratase small subunit [Gammaproteobacteria bacterium]HIN74377.1 3-isopropylmalate dehydratase small subunit [Gammaproteobacteria bacterium]